MPLFATTVFLSAFLLFQIQPVVAKMIQPWFGGSSSVWTLCMVFFQVELLLGYAYVHWVHEKLRPARQPWVHGALLLLSLATLPVVADPAWKLTAQAQPTWSVLGVLATTVGELVQREPVTAYVALGANLGDPLTTVRQALHTLARTAC